MKPCKQCGDCCSLSPCGIAMATIGDDRPCKALEPMPDGTFLCGLILHPSQYIDICENAGWKDHFLGGVFAKMLGVGMGCCTSPETKIMAKRMTEFYGKKVTYEQAVRSQIQEMEGMKNKALEKGRSKSA